jgi:radical SAM protein with 4Fe4S-binding SPASM domain
MGSKMSKQEFYFQWHFMNSCNLRCAHCYQEGYEFRNLDLPDLLHIANEISAALKKWGMLGRLSLTGGEPFLSPHLFNLLDYFEQDEQTKQLDILTNGTCIDDKSIKRLKTYRKLRQIQISLDGANQSTHDLVRGNGAYEKAVDAIQRLRRNDIEVSLMFTIMRRNMYEAIKVIDFAETYGVNAVTVERVTPCGNSSIKDILTSSEIENIYNAVTVRANNVNAKLTVRRLRPLWINTTPLNRCTDSNIGGFCPVGLTSMAILYDGTVLPCRRLNVPIGNVLRESLFRIWFGNNVLWRIRDKNNLQGKCHNCHNINRCGGCRAIAYETTGDYMGEDIQCWI